MVHISFYMITLKISDINIFSIKMHMLKAFYLFKKYSLHLLPNILNYNTFANLNLKQNKIYQSSESGDIALVVLVSAGCAVRLSPSLILVASVARTSSIF